MEHAATATEKGSAVCTGWLNVVNYDILFCFGFRTIAMNNMLRS
jgi:hypothetical protein